MAKSRFLDDGSSSILIETDTENVSPTASIVQFNKAIKRIGEEVQRTIGSMESKPSELSIAFGLSLVSNGQFLITQGAEAGNFQISMKFTGGSGSIRDMLPR